MRPEGRDDGIVRRRVTVRGRVQGVGFRMSCARRAAEAGVAGWVRNTQAGDVEAVFEGPAPAVEAMVAWCRVGPPMAGVRDVQVSTGESPDGTTGFDVR